MYERFGNTLDSIESLVARLTLRHQSEVGVLIVFFFHSLFKCDAEIMSGLVNPIEAMTAGRLREIIDYLHCEGFMFPEPDRISNLPVDGKYALLTADDGYCNNVRWLEVMKEFKVPATFFVCTSHVLSGNAFYWDVLWRERTRRGTAVPKIREEQTWLESASHRERELYLRNQFGTQSLKPVGDLDRPFRPAELREFASTSGVSIGAHTRHHENLCLLPLKEAETEISGSLADLEQITGSKSEMLSYPHGAWNSSVRSLAAAAGIRYGFTTLNCRNVLPVEIPALTLNRVKVVPTQTVQAQCLLFRSRYRIRPYVSSLMHHLKHT